MQSNDTPTPTTQDTGRIIERIEQALQSLHSANDAAAILASHLSPILPTGATEEIAGLLAAGTRHEAGHENESAVEVLIRSLSRRADALAAAITATREGVRL